jgi:hypothetical protein
LYVHISKYQHDKMGTKVTFGILVGVDKHTKGFRYFDPRKRKITVSVDITFDENAVCFYDCSQSKGD